MKGWLAVATAAWVLGSMAEAADLKVIAGGSMTAPLNRLSPEFEKATGHKLSIHFDVAGDKKVSLVLSSSATVIHYFRAREFSETTDAQLVLVR